MAGPTIEEELALLSESPEEQLKQINKCLELTNNHKAQASGVWVPEIDEDFYFCRLRLVALQHRDRLATAIELCKG